jgi:hypothetical protein
MTTHLCFNGVLTVAAIVLALSPGQTVQGDGYTITAPHGWHLAHSSATGQAEDLIGPSEATVEVIRMPVGTTTPTTDQMLAIIEGSTLPQVSAAVDIDRSSAHKALLPAGDAVEVNISYHNQPGELVMLPTGGSVLIIAFESSGSTRAQTDFNHMLETVTVS